MNILFTVEYYRPQIGGAEAVVQSIAEFLARGGHKVSVATTLLRVREIGKLNEVNIIEFGISGNSSKGIKEFRRNDIKRYRELLVDGQYDVIFQYAAQAWHTDLMFEIIDEIFAKKILVPCGYSGLSGLLRRLKYFDYFRTLPNYLAKYDLIIYHCKDYLDYKFGGKNKLRKFRVLPVGINKNEFSDVYLEGDQKFRDKYMIDSKYMILNVSNHYAHVKEPNFLIKAFEYLEQIEKDLTFVAMGESPFGAASS